MRKLKTFKNAYIRSGGLSRTHLSVAEVSGLRSTKTDSNHCLLRRPETSATDGCVFSSYGWMCV